MARKISDSTTPFTVGENVAVKMSQRTLLLILASFSAAVFAWTNLKSETAKNRDLILELTAVRSSDVVDRKADHDLLVRCATGVELLQRKAERDERRENRGSIVNRP